MKNLLAGLEHKAKTSAANPKYNSLDVDTGSSDGENKFDNIFYDDLFPYLSPKNKPVNLPTNPSLLMSNPNGSIDIPNHTRSYFPAAALEVEMQAEVEAPLQKKASNSDLRLFTFDEEEEDLSDTEELNPKTSQHLNSPMNALQLFNLLQQKIPYAIPARLDLLSCENDLSGCDSDSPFRSTSRVPLEKQTNLSKNFAPQHNPSSTLKKGKEKQFTFFQENVPGSPTSKKPPLQGPIIGFKRG